MTSLKTRVAELRKMAEKASKGPWLLFNVRKTIAVYCNKERNGIPLEAVQWMGFDGCDLPQKEKVANATLIVATRNTVPEMAEFLEQVMGALEHTMKCDGKPILQYVSGTGAPGDDFKPHYAPCSECEEARALLKTWNGE